MEGGNSAVVSSAYRSAVGHPAADTSSVIALSIKNCLTIVQMIHSELL